jgi:hypothetical protein
MTVGAKASHIVWNGYQYERDTKLAPKPSNPNRPPTQLPNHEGFSNRPSMEVKLPPKIGGEMSTRIYFSLSGWKTHNFAINMIYI